MLTIESLSKSYGEHRPRSGDGEAEGEGAAPERVNAVDAVSLEIQAGELFTLLGPSGCGKTTTLRSIAGLERPDRGRILLGERVLFDGSSGVSVPANKRGLGMVFQSYAIWPHMTVFQNASFPLDVLPRRKRPAKAEIRARVERVLEVTELSSFADRRATKLSGGQQQRLALARALATQPDVMLLDEPLSNLDAKLRETMRFELTRLQRELGLTTIYVTHDQTEALAMSSRIAVLNEGRVEQVGRPRDVYTRPQSRFVAEFIGTSNFIAGRVGERVGELVRIETAATPVWSAAGAATPAQGSEVLLAIRPESLRVAAASSTEPLAAGAATRNEWPATVVSQAFLGDSIDYVLAAGPTELRARCNPSVALAPGAPAHVAVDPADVLVMPAA
ncbi:ABC transporter ATP-binding protein [Conexibacter sp. CPCC 206217]|uniref:ABC transporter ATP-binding protein n=1 Tax=Conexibacter sp. CPCC 206217 TaxID=3064574 RepID=UPI0027172DC5|nr:ABC transporter ATP-binding protein [Conexibacter sp. CPCC 206217]MDO8212652.1 ABC transporter ATP-binding protein [Conexibacter sp. CPCC 206217]